MHLVQQHTFDIQCSSSDFGREIHNQLSSLLENHFYPKLEILFDKYAVENHNLNIGSIALELPNISSKNWKNELVNHSLMQMEEYLKKNIPQFEINNNTNQNNTSKGFISNEQQLKFLFFHFLKTGILEENSISKNLAEIVSKTKITIAFLEELIKNLTEDPICFERWIFSIPNFFKKTCLESLVDFQLISKVNFKEIIENQETNSAGLEHFKQQLKTNKTFLFQWLEILEWTNYIQKKTNSKQLVFKNFIELSARYWSISLDEMRQIFKIINSPNTAANMNIFKEMDVFIESFKSSEISILHKITEKPNAETVNETHFIANAGLVILHPFLKSLFEQLNLCKNDIWTKKMSQHKAILLTQFMITGKEKSFENELVLNKILCGFPLESVVNIHLKITKKEKEKCYSLLQAVSEHWKSMSKSSIEALQESFLQRNGKIVIQSENRFELWVEEKGFDILLEQLPWGIGMVKTPWMEEYLTCNWS